MAKREDASYIEAIYKTWGKKVAAEWQSLPLLILEDDVLTEVLKIDTSHDNNIYLSEFKEMYLTNKLLPWTDFTIFVHSGSKTLYWRVTVNEEGMRFILVTMLNSSVPVVMLAADIFEDEEGRFRIVKSESMDVLPRNNPYFQDMDYNLWGANGNNETSRVSINETIDSTTCFLKWYHDSDFYPVEVRSDRKIKSKISAKKPWKRTDLPRIVFMNTIPLSSDDTDKEVGVGEKKGPLKCGHPRIGHYHTLKNERFVNHPDYQTKIWRKATWVGPLTSNVNGKRYKVLLPDDKFKETQ